MNIVIIDYGLCNLDSVRRAVEECGHKPVISSSPNTLETASKLILPGVAAFADAMANLKTANLDVSIKNAVTQNQIPILGLCLGMHLLADLGIEGSESSGTQGLGLISGKVTKLISKNEKERIPHMGWNEVVYEKNPVLFQNIPSGKDFYFAHSYHFELESKANEVATTPYCGGFTSVINKNHIWGVQFHPEKSQKYGFSLLRNFLNI